MYKFLKIVIKIVQSVKYFMYKKNIGRNSYIDRTVKILGWKHISIGHNTIIGEFGWLNVNARIKDFIHIEIGNSCYIGKRVFISPANKILIKDYCLMGDDCKLIAANHRYENPMISYASSGASNKENITIGVNVWLGTMICIVGNISIGHGSIIGAGSIVTKDIPPFSIAVGNPCQVIKRYNFDTSKWIDIDKWDITFEVFFPEESEYLKEINKNTLNVNAYINVASHRFGNSIN